MASSRPRIRILGSQAKGILHGTTEPGAVIEAVNVSRSPGERIRPLEPVVIARADARGRFDGKLPMRPNDLVRVRARSVDGALGEWRDLRARGLVGRPRPAVVAVFRVGLRALDEGAIRIFNLNPARPLAEPGATLFFVNARTGERVRAIMNARGTITGRLRVRGRAGDIVRVELGDREVGTLVTPSPKPSPPRGLVRPSHQHQKIGFVPSARCIDAPLFARRPHPNDVLQSELQNCYLASAAAAIAHVRPEVLERAIAPLARGKYRVRFKLGRRYQPHDVIVTSDFYVRPSGELLYGTSTTLWWPVLEKAFASLRGSYKRVGRGGTSHRVFELLLGRPPRHFFIEPASVPENVWSEVTGALADKRPVVVGTSPPWTAKKYRTTGIIADHAYAVLGTRESADGRRFLTIRNPWGEDAGPPERVRRNGAFEITLDELLRYFQVVSTVR